MSRSPDLMSGRFAVAIVALVAAIIVLATPALASEFAVQSANTNSGVRAARLTVAKTCTAGDATVPNGSISSDPGVEPCGVLTANDVDVVSGTVRFRAGSRIEIGHGFSVNSASNFTAETGETVLGAAYVRDESPASVGYYRVGFYIDPDSLTLSQNTQQFDHVVAYDAQGAREFLIGVTYNSGLTENRLFVTAFENAGTARTTKGLCELTLGSGWQYVEATWKASTGTDGDLEVSINGGASQSLAGCLSLGSGLANASGEISAVEWGAKNVIDGSMGSADLDDFSSWSN